MSEKNPKSPFCTSTSAIIAMWRWCSGTSLLPPAVRRRWRRQELRPARPRSHSPRTELQQPPQRTRRRGIALEHHLRHVWSGSYVAPAGHVVRVHSASARNLPEVSLTCTVDTRSPSHLFNDAVPPCGREPKCPLGSGRWRVEDAMTWYDNGKVERLERMPDSR